MENVKKDEVGMLMKETGMSVMMTSINNILSFFTGTLLPIPALRAFCAQVRVFVILFFCNIKFYSRIENSLTSKTRS